MCCPWAGLPLINEQQGKVIHWVKSNSKELSKSTHSFCLSYNFLLHTGADVKVLITPLTFFLMVLFWNANERIWNGTSLRLFSYVVSSIMILSYREWIRYLLYCSWCSNQSLTIVRPRKKFFSFMVVEGEAFKIKPFVIRTDHQSLKHLLEQKLTHPLQYKVLTKLVGL